MSNIADLEHGCNPKPYTPKWFFFQSGGDPTAYCNHLLSCHEAGLVNFLDEVRTAFYADELPATFRRDLFRYCDKNWLTFTRRLARISADREEWGLSN